MVKAHACSWHKADLPGIICDFRFLKVKQTLSSGAVLKKNWTAQE